MKALNNSKFSAISYYHKAKVNLITNYFDAAKMVEDPHSKNLLPDGIYRYRQQLGSLDHFDRMLHLYLSRVRNIKWTSAFGNFLLKIAACLTYCIATSLMITSSLQETEDHLYTYLAGKATFRKLPPLQRRISINVGSAHIPIRQQKKARCVQCQATGKDSSSIYKCRDCDIYLHVDCFEIYHK